MRKIYEAPNTILSNICMIVNRKPIDISFEPMSAFEGSRTGRGSMFITENKDLQDAIESSRYWHTEVWLYKEEETENDIAEEEEQRDFIKVKVDSPSDARDYLEDNYNVEKKRILNVKQIKAAGEKVGVIFEGI